MSALKGVLLAANVAAVAATAKTILQLTAPTNQRVKLSELSVTFEGVSPTAVPVQVDLMIQSTAGTSSSGTIGKVSPGASETLQTTGNITFTVEPSYGTILKTWNIHPQAGVIYPFADGDIVMAGGTRLGVVVTAAANVTVTAYAEFEE